MATRSETEFRLGRLTASEGVAEKATYDAAFAAFCYQCMQRHANGDWGNIPGKGKSRNQRAIEEGSRILSAYRKGGYPEVWITTEADRSTTMILFPYEYQAKSC